MNLRPDDPFGVALLQKVDGGSRLTYNCLVSDQDGQIPYTCPIYIREGAIIPKISVRDYIPDPSLPTQPPNPITLHIYPGKDNEYDMYLDDGISRQSAPSHDYVPATSSRTGGYGIAHDLVPALIDPKAGSAFVHVKISQTTTHVSAEDDSIASRVNRRIWIRAPWRGQVDGGLEKIIGTEYTVVLWHEQLTSLGSVVVSSDKQLEYKTDTGVRATIVTVPVDLAHSENGVTVSVGFDA